MKYIVIIITLTASSVLMPAVAAKATPKSTQYETSSYKFNTFYIHNLGTKPFKLNHISVLFEIGTATPQQQLLTYNKNIKPGKTGKISNASILFNEPIGTPINYLGISNININSNTIIKVDAGNYDIYITNQGDTWKETTAPTVATPKAKTITAKIAPSAKINPSTEPKVFPVAKTHTLKSAAIVVKNKANTNIPKSNAAKAINTASMPKATLIKPDIVTK